jgi:hypothetical protein
VKIYCADARKTLKFAITYGSASASRVDGDRPGGGLEPLKQISIGAIVINCKNEIGTGA